MVARRRAGPVAAARDVDQTPRGRLGVTADPVFGDAFVGELVVEYARAWPEVRVEVLLTRHQLIVVAPDGSPTRWPFRGRAVAARFLAPEGEQCSFVPLFDSHFRVTTTLPQVWCFRAAAG